MMSKEAMKLALDHSEPSILSPGWTLVRNEDIAALREALAEPDFWEGYVPEPVGAIGSSIKSESPLGCNGPTGPAQQEPVALETVYETIIRWDEGGGKRSRRELARRIVALYTRPQAREPLTDEEIDRLWSQSLADTEGETWLPLREFARAIEAAHGIGEKK